MNYLLAFFYFFSGSQTLTQKFKTLNLSLSIACESIEPIFNKLGGLGNVETDDIKQLEEFEMHLQTTLKHLIHISINNKSHDADHAIKLKRLYQLTLQSQKRRDEFKEFSQYLRNALIAVVDAAII